MSPQTPRPRARRRAVLPVAALALLTSGAMAWSGGAPAPVPAPPALLEAPAVDRGAAPPSDALPAGVTPPGATRATAPAVALAREAPTLRTSTYLGHREWDEGNDVEVDQGGNTYVAGFTLSTGFPRAGAAAQRFSGLADAFVTKLAPDGSLLWSTPLGGRDLDVGNSLALDDAGNAYVTGRTASADFPTTGGVLQPRLRGQDCQGEPCHDAFVTKLSPGGQVLYSTYLGGSANEEAIGIAVDRLGRAWVTGNTDSRDFPTRRALQARFGSPPCPGDLPCPYDTFLAVLSPTGRTLTVGTYLGGDATDTSSGVTLDERGDAYVTGTTRSADFPVTGGALQRRIAGTACGPPPGEPCLDAFVSKVTLRNDGGRAALAYSTYFGGTENDRAGGKAVDRRGRAVLTGSTQSPDLPLRRPLQAHLDNASCTSELPEEQCDDGFVTQLTAGAGGLVYSTYLGGKAEDQGLGITVDRQGDTYVVGRTDSRDFPTGAAVQRRFGGYIDGFAARLRAGTGALVWSTFLGGEEADRALGLDVAATGRVHVTGRTLSPDFPVRRPLQPELHGDDYDAFVTVLRQPGA